MKVEVIIGSIKTFIDIENESQTQTIKNIVKLINDEYFSLISELNGSNVNDRFLLTFLFLAIINRKEKIFTNFELNIKKLILSSVNFLYDDNSFDNQLISALILAKNQEITNPKTQEKKQKSIFDVVNTNESDTKKLKEELESLKIENQKLKEELFKTQKTFMETINTKQIELTQTQSKLFEIQNKIKIDENSMLDFLNKVIEKLNIIEDNI